MRYNPLLTDGTETRSLSEWRNFARQNGFVTETPLVSSSAGEVLILDCSGVNFKTIKQLKRINQQKWKVKIV